MILFWRSAMTTAFVAVVVASAEAETDSAEVVSPWDRAELELDEGLMTFDAGGIVRVGVAVAD
jgi:hypothetical protein